MRYPAFSTAVQSTIGIMIFGIGIEKKKIPPPILFHYLILTDSIQSYIRIAAAQLSAAKARARFCQESISITNGSPACDWPFLTQVGSSVIDDCTSQSGRWRTTRGPYIPCNLPSSSLSSSQLFYIFTFLRTKTKDTQTLVTMAPKIAIVYVCLGYRASCPLIELLNA